MKIIYLEKKLQQDIMDSLQKWRETRHLTLENQRAGLLGNLAEEIMELTRAYQNKDEIEIIDALCDIAVFSMGAIKKIDKEITLDIFFDDEELDNISLSAYIAQLVADFSNLFVESNQLDYFLLKIINHCANTIQQAMGYNFYECMKETIKEINSRTGKYDENLKKFIKDVGAYPDEIIELKQTFDVANETNKTITFSNQNKIIIKGEITYKKWYRADYNKCKIAKK